VVMWQHNVWCVCLVFCVERYVGLNIPLHTERHTSITFGVCAWRSVWRGIERHASITFGLCAWHSVWRGMLDSTYLSTHNAMHTHQTLCCHITTIDLLHF